MKTRLNRLKYIAVVLLFGSTTVSISSCKKKIEATEINKDTLMTQMSRDFTLIESTNGVRKYRFETPLLERYEFASSPYMEYREGIHIQSYKEGTEEVESELRADYAIFYEDKKLWEARGNVTAQNAKGNTLKTQQLFWDQNSHKIYSNVESTVTQGEDVVISDGFESDEKMEEFTFRRPRGRIAVDNIMEQQPSTQVQQP